MVVLLHALPTAMEDGLAIGQFPYIAMTARFAVPFFFITAGYFQRIDGVAPAAIVWRALRRLLPIYLIWIAVYWFVCRIVPLPDMEWNGNWRSLLQGGPLFHLWFLPALGFGLALVGIARVKLGLRTTTALAIGLALIGLGLTSYQAPLFGHEALEPRRGIFFAPAFVVIGAWLSQSRAEVSVGRATAIALAGVATIIGEEMALRQIMGWPSVRSHDISLGTFFYGTGAFCSRVH